MIFGPNPSVFCMNQLSDFWSRKKTWLNEWTMSQVSGPSPYVPEWNHLYDFRWKSKYVWNETSLPFMVETWKRLPERYFWFLVQTCWTEPSLQFLVQKQAKLNHCYNFWSRVELTAFSDFWSSHKCCIINRSISSPGTHCSVTWIHLSDFAFNHKRCMVMHETISPISSFHLLVPFTSTGMNTPLHSTRWWNTIRLLIPLFCASPSPFV